MEDYELILAQEFCTHHQVELKFIYSLQEFGLVEIITTEGNDYVAADRLNELEKMIRLHYDLNVNMEGIDVILHLLKQLEEVQSETNELRNQLRFYK
jgi:hypothetical protein